MEKLFYTSILIKSNDFNLIKVLLMTF